MSVKIIKINKTRRNIVVSRRIVLEEERESMRSALLSEIGVGQIRQGVVKNVTDFGVFIDLGGVDGLLHITDMSWGPDPSSFRAGQSGRDDRCQDPRFR